MDVRIPYCAFSRHHAPFRQTFRSGLDAYLIRLQVEGTSEVAIDGRWETILPGELLLFRPGDPYEIRIGAGEGASWPSSDYYLFCAGDAARAWWDGGPRPRRTKLPEFARLAGVWHQLFLEKHRPDGGSPVLLGHLFGALCVLLDRSIGEAAEGAAGASHAAMRIRAYVEEHAAEPLTLERVARHAGLSVSRVVHLFKEQFGVSVMQHVQRVRLALAADMMRMEGLTLERIAEDAGFGSYAYFHRVFREAYGMPPGRYRREHG